MENSIVKVSLTVGPRLSVYADEVTGLFHHAYMVKFVKPINGGKAWRLVLTPDVRGRIFRDRPQKGRVGVTFSVSQELIDGGDAPRMFGVCEAKAFHSENGEITIHLPENLPVFRPHAKRSSSGTADPMILLERAVRDINRIKDDVEGLNLSFTDKGKLQATITVVRTIGFE